VIVIKPGVELAVRGNLVGGAVEFVNEGEGSLRVISDPPSSKVSIMAGQRTIVRVSFMKKDEPFTFSYEPEARIRRSGR
jgi:hypothetical protein